MVTKILHTVTGKTYDNRKEAKADIGNWKFRLAIQNKEIRYIDVEQDRVLTDEEYKTVLVPQIKERNNYK